MIFAGIQGSGVADASAIGSIMIPSMVKQGYGKDYAAAIIASAATIGPIIPPSIAMIMYAYYTELSVGKLFLGGFVPGVLIGIGLMIVNAILFRSRKYDFERPRQNVERDPGQHVLFHRRLDHADDHRLRDRGRRLHPDGIGDRRRRVRPFVRGSDLEKAHSEKAGQGHRRCSANTTASVMIILAVAGVFSNILTRLHFQDFVINNIVLGIRRPLSGDA